MNSSQLKRAKRRIRRDVLARREEMPAEERRTRGVRATERFLGLTEVERAGTVMLFWSFGSEVSTSEAIERLRGRDATVVLPRIEGAEIVPVPYVPGDPTRAASFGIEEPASGSPIPADAIDVIAVPGVAFDRRGARIGYGGGYYDRFLRHVRGFTVGLVFAMQVLEDDLPAGPSDRRVDAVVTEAETIRVST